MGSLFSDPVNFVIGMTHVPMGMLSMELNIVLLKIFHITLIWNYFSLPIICNSIFYVLSPIFYTYF